MARGARWLFCLCLCALLACSTTEYATAPTQVLLQLSCTDPVLLQRTQVLRIAVSTLEEGQWKPREPVMLDAAALRWPLDVPIFSRRGGDPSRVFQVVVQALADGIVQAETRAVSRFTPDKHKLLKRELFACPNHALGFVCAAADCNGEMCTTCNKAGTCDQVGLEQELEDAPTSPDGAFLSDAAAATSDSGAGFGGDAASSPDAATQGGVDASAGGGGRDAAVAGGAEDAASDAFVAARDAGGGNLPADASDGMVTLRCDQDEDGFYAARSECDVMRGSAAADCDDTSKASFPGAPVVCGDGVRNDCSSWDSDAELSLGLTEATFVPEKALEILPSEYFVQWAYAAGRVGGASPSTIVAFRYEPLTSGGGVGQIQLRNFNASGAKASSATVTLPADLRWWTGGPQPVWTGSAFAFHGTGLQNNVGYASLDWTWNTTASNVMANYAAFPTGCSRMGATSGPVSVDKQAWAALIGDFSSGGTPVLAYFGATYSRCTTVSATVASIDLASDRIVVGGEQSNVKIWDLSPSAPVTYTLAKPRVVVSGEAGFARNGIGVASPSQGSLVIAYGSAGGVTIEVLDVANEQLRRVNTLDIPHSGYEFRNVLLTGLSNGVLLSLFGVGPPDSQGKLPGTLRSIVLRTLGDLDIVSDRSFNLKDGPYAAPVIQVVGPAVAEPWFDAVFLRAVGNELRQGSVRYCSKL
jgi:hypothetical protein